MKINAMPLTMLQFFRIRYLVTMARALRWLSCNGRLVMGTSLGDKVVIVIALLLLAVVAVVSAEFPWIIRAARLVAAP
jgi:hypothetical protein